MVGFYPLHVMIVDYLGESLNYDWLNIYFICLFIKLIHFKIINKMITTIIIRVAQGNIRIYGRFISI